MKIELTNDSAIEYAKGAFLNRVPVLLFGESFTIRSFDDYTDFLGRRTVTLNLDEVAQPAPSAERRNNDEVRRQLGPTGKEKTR